MFLRIMRHLVPLVLNLMKTLLNNSNEKQNFKLKLEGKVSVEVILTEVKGKAKKGEPEAETTTMNIEHNTCQTRYVSYLEVLQNCVSRGVVRISYINIYITCNNI